MFIGDYLALNFVDRVFAHPMGFSGFENLTALFGYSLQVYVDFSGYTDIAIGVALLLGFRLPKNFNAPLQGHQRGQFLEALAHQPVHLAEGLPLHPPGREPQGQDHDRCEPDDHHVAGGLWHGASWQFVIWGGLNGVGLVVYKLWRGYPPMKRASTGGPFLEDLQHLPVSSPSPASGSGRESMEKANQLINQVTP
jgi:alginate O-acetyltransferase complex protein AlgI